MLDRKPSITDASALLLQSGLAPADFEPSNDLGPRIRNGRPDSVDVAPGINPAPTAGTAVVGGLHHQVNALERRLRATERELGRMRRRLALAELAAKTDPLTEIANRRHFEEVLAAAVAVMRQLRQPLSVLMIDVDHFKRFNDDFGHPIGDHVLRFVAGVLSHRWQADTFAARYGGEEFAVLSLRTPLGAALERAEFIRTRLARHRAIMRGTQERLRGVTVSIGVAELRPGDTPAEIIRRADVALYAAKRGGRDRVVADQAA